MSGFSDLSLQHKLGKLSASQQGIESLSLWLIHHRKHAPVAVATWLRELRGAAPGQKLKYIYLCNDVLLQSRKRGPEYNLEFRAVLEDALGDVYLKGTEKDRGAILRMINIWKERGAYPTEFLVAVENAIQGKGLAAAAADADASDPAEHVTAEVLLQNLAGAELGQASLKAKRQAIEALPSSLFDPLLLGSITDQAAGQKRLEDVQAAILAVSQCRTAMATNVDLREKTIAQLRGAVVDQTEALRSTQNNLALCKERLAAASRLKREIKTHLSSLPTPMSSEALTPLPQATDLFDGAMGAPDEAPAPSGGAAGDDGGLVSASTPALQPSADTITDPRLKRRRLSTEAEATTPPTTAASAASEPEAATPQTPPAAAEAPVSGAGTAASSPGARHRTPVAMSSSSLKRRRSSLSPAKPAAAAAEAVS